MFKISIASDHNGVNLKDKIIKHLKNKKHEVLDLGPFDDKESVDYPDYAKKVCESLMEEQSQFGILICGTGIGMSIAANRRSEIRAALCTNEFMAEMARAHNDANILIIGSRISSDNEVISILDKFLTSSFEGGRHKSRLAKIT